VLSLSDLRHLEAMEHLTLTHHLAIMALRWAVLALNKNILQPHHPHLPLPPAWHTHSPISLPSLVRQQKHPGTTPLFSTALPGVHLVSFSPLFCARPGLNYPLYTLLQPSPPQLGPPPLPLDSNSTADTTSALPSTFLLWPPHISARTLASMRILKVYTRTIPRWGWILHGGDCDILLFPITGKVLPHHQYHLTHPVPAFPNLQYFHLFLPSFFNCERLSKAHTAKPLRRHSQEIKSLSHSFLCL
jgi:hypothetical protein